MSYSNHPQDIARREGFREGAFASAWVTLAIAVVVFIGLHMALTMRSDAIHEQAMRLSREVDVVVIRDLRKDLARYADIAAVEKAYAEREVGR